MVRVDDVVWFTEGEFRFLRLMGLSLNARPAREVVAVMDEALDNWVFRSGLDVVNFRMMERLRCGISPCPNAPRPIPDFPVFPFHWQ